MADRWVPWGVSLLGSLPWSPPRDASPAGESIHSEDDDEGQPGSVDGARAGLGQRLQADHAGDDASQKQHLDG